MFFQRAAFLAQRTGIQRRSFASRASLPGRARMYVGERCSMVTCRGGLRHGWDQGDGRGTAAYDDDLLTGVVEILRPLLRMDDASAELVGTGEGRSIALLVVVVTGAHEQERAGVNGRLVVRSGFRDDGPARVG